MTTIYLVRHCETKGNRQRLFQGHIDMDISEAGVQQLARLAERFRTVPLDAVYSSPLLRAMRTAQAVNRYHDLPIHQDARLIEINGGSWEGPHWILNKAAAGCGNRGISTPMAANRCVLFMIG